MGSSNTNKFLLTLKRQKEFTEKLEHWAESLVIFAFEMKKYEDDSTEMVREEMNEHVRDLALDVLTLKKRGNQIEKLAETLQKSSAKPSGEKPLSWDEREKLSLERTLDGRIHIHDSRDSSINEF